MSTIKEPRRPPTPRRRCGSLLRWTDGARAGGTGVERPQPTTRRGREGRGEGTKPFLSLFSHHSNGNLLNFSLFHFLKMDNLWDEVWDSLVQEVQCEADEDAEREAVPRPIHHRRTIRRDHAGSHQRLMEDYFSDDPRYPPEIFRRRLKMSQRLFIHIATSLARRYRCFTLRRYCSGWIGLSTFQK